MGLFDNLKTPQPPPAAAPQGGGNRTVEVTFAKLPETLEEFKALPQAQLSTPFDTAALTVLALCFYPQDKALSLEMLNYLRGPRPLSGYDQQFIRDRFMDKDYVPRSYFGGAKPENNYTPAEPYSIQVSENPYSYQEQGCARLFLTSGGADSPRPVQLRMTKEGKWFLWEQFLLSDIRLPASADPWA